MTQRNLVALLGGLLLLIAGRQTFGIEWAGATGDFLDGTNWAGGSVPEFGDAALINNGGTAQLAGDAEVSVLRIGLNGGDGTYEQTGGLILAQGAFIGDNSNGTATIEGGEFMIGNDSIHVGWRPGAVGVLNMTGSEALVTSGDDFQLGREGTGTLNLIDGQLRAGFTVIGKFGTGLWNQTGGLFDQAFGDIEIGDGGRDDQDTVPGPRVGTMNVSAGFVQSAGHLAIGNRRGGGEVSISGGVLAMTGNEQSSIYVGRGMQSSPGTGLDTTLRITGSDSIVIANGGLFMNPESVSSSATLVAEITGAEHTPILTAGDADVTNGILKVELNGYVPAASDSWVLVQSGTELDSIIEQIDEQVDAAGYDPLEHAFPLELGEINGPFDSVDTTMAALPAGLTWDVSYSDEQIVLTVMGSAVLPGDFNANQMLDVGDINMLVWESASGNNNAAFDLDGDGAVNRADVTLWAKDLANTWIGDANVDGEFNSADLVAIFQAGKFEQDLEADWSQGDWTGDHRLDSGDLVAAFQDGGFEQGPRSPNAAVPEPSSIILLTLALAVITSCGGARRSIADETNNGWK